MSKATVIFRFNSKVNTPIGFKPNSIYFGDGAPQRYQFGLVFNCKGLVIELEGDISTKSRQTAQWFNQTVSGNDSHIIHTHGDDTKPQELFVALDGVLTIDGYSYDITLGLGKNSDKDNWYLASESLQSRDNHNSGKLVFSEQLTNNHLVNEGKKINKQRAKELSVPSYKITTNGSNVFELERRKNLLIMAGKNNSRTHFFPNDEDGNRRVSARGIVTYQNMTEQVQLIEVYRDGEVKCPIIRLPVKARGRIKYQVPPHIGRTKYQLKIHQDQSNQDQKCCNITGDDCNEQVSAEIVVETGG